MSHDDELADAKLKAYLKINEPIVPAASDNELSNIEVELGLDNPKSKFIYTPWFALSGVGTLVASLVGAWILTNTPVDSATSDKGLLISGRDAAVAVNVSTEDADTEVLPTIDVGEEFLGLIAER